MRYSAARLQAWGQRLLHPEPRLREVMLPGAVFGLVLLLLAGALLWHLMQTRTMLAVESLPSVVETWEDGFARPPATRTRLYVENNSRALARFFDTLNYDLEAVRQGRAPVPRVYLAALPDDLKALSDVGHRKSLFLRSLLPIVLRENELLRAQHSRLLAMRSLRAQGRPLGHADRRWLETMAARYDTGTDDLDALLRRVDAVPPSIALAQAAMESGWGSSRFAREGNAIFGQWTWSEGDAGIVPRARTVGASYRIRAFETVADSVRAYLHNINTAGAYRQFRALRAQMRRESEPLDGIRLAAGLSRYSVERGVYVRKLRSLIAHNRLHELNRARLSGTYLARGDSGRRPQDAPGT